MKKGIDTKKPIYFYDDRSKDYSLVKMTDILYEDFHNCFCKVQIDDDEFDTILFDKDSGEVRTTNFEFWYATNKVPTLVEEDGEKEWRFKW